MPDKEKVIKALECCCELNAFDKPNCKDCPAECMSGYMSIPFIKDVLELLKEQEAAIDDLKGFINGFSKNAVPVVLCRDCEYWDNSGYLIKDRGMCNNVSVRCSRDGDWFCADGKRRLLREQEYDMMPDEILEWMLEGDRFGLGENWTVDSEPKSSEEQAGYYIQRAIDALKGERR